MRTLRTRKQPPQSTSPFGPDAIEVESTRLHVNGSCVASFAVVGYPREVRPGWLAPLFTHNGSVDIALHTEPMPSQIAAERLRRQLARLESSRRVDASRGHLLDPTIEVAADDAQDLANRLARGEARLFRIGLTVTVRARDVAALDQGVARIRAILAALLIDLRPTTFRQLEGWKATLPLGLDEVGIARTFDTHALAATYPFTPSGFAQPNGVLYGRNVSSSGLVFLDRFAQNNHNSVVLACSGAGKSYFAKLELLRSLYRGIDIIVIDPEDEYRRLCESVDGVYRHLGANGVKLNPFDLGESADAFVERALFIHSLIATLIGRELDAASKATLDRSIVAAYAHAGITSDTGTHRRRPPVMSDLDAALRSEGSIGIALAEQLAPYTSGTHRHLFDWADDIPEHVSSRCLLTTRRSRRAKGRCNNGGSQSSVENDQQPNDIASSHGCRRRSVAHHARSRWGSIPVPSCQVRSQVLVRSHGGDPGRGGLAEFRIGTGNRVKCRDAGTPTSSPSSHRDARPIVSSFRW